MAEAPTSPDVAPPSPAPVARLNTTMSETLLNEKWDRCLSSGVVQTSIGFGAGVVLSVLLFRRRAFPVWIGTGFGAGKAWEECDNRFRTAATASRDGLRVLRPQP